MTFKPEKKVAIRGEALRRLIQHKRETGAEMTFTVNRVLEEHWARIDALEAQRGRDYVHPGVYTTANAPDEENE